MKNVELKEKFLMEKKATGKAKVRNYNLLDTNHNLYILGIEVSCNKEKSTSMTF